MRIQRSNKRPLLPQGKSGEGSPRANDSSASSDGNNNESGSTDAQRAAGQGRKRVRKPKMNWVAFDQNGQRLRPVGVNHHRDGCGCIICDQIRRRAAGLTKTSRESRQGKRKREALAQQLALKAAGLGQDASSGFASMNGNASVVPVSAGVPVTTAGQFPPAGNFAAPTAGGQVAAPDLANAVLNRQTQVRHVDSCQL
jgi:hypothetical protein